MSDFDTRPKGTVMYGAFDTFAPAERALRVLKNAGYARAAFVGADVDERPSDEPAVIVVDAAATGAVRAAEILEEFGAQIRYAGRSVEPPSVVPQAVVPQADDSLTYEPKTMELESAQARPERFVIMQESALTIAPVERKPRVRKHSLIDTPRESVQPPNAPVEREDVVIVTRSMGSLAIEG